MSNFSVSYLVGFGSRSDDSGSDGSMRRTPSPVDRTLSPNNSDTGRPTCQDDQSIANMLLSLEKRSNLTPSSPKDEKQREVLKPSYSYIGLISMAILNAPDKKILLGDLYQYIMDKFPYYNNQERSWRNSIRHNLSINECFIKNGRADNGKGNFWSIHPACIEDFAKGDYRRRQARRRARKNTRNINVSEHQNAYRSNVGYVPMSSTPIGYHPYATTTSLPVKIDSVVPQSNWMDLNQSIYSSNDTIQLLPRAQDAYHMNTIPYGSSSDIYIRQMQSAYEQPMISYMY